MKKSLLTLLFILLGVVIIGGAIYGVSTTLNDVTIIGPQGEVGPTGEQGPIGPTGPAGSGGGGSSTWEVLEEIYFSYDTDTVEIEEDVWVVMLTIDLFIDDYIILGIYLEGMREPIQLINILNDVTTLNVIGAFNNYYIVLLNNDGYLTIILQCNDYFTQNLEANFILYGVSK